MERFWTHSFPDLHPETYICSFDQKKKDIYIRSITLLIDLFPCVFTKQSILCIQYEEHTTPLLKKHITHVIISINTYSYIFAPIFFRYYLAFLIFI